MGSAEKVKVWRGNHKIIVRATENSAWNTDKWKHGNLEKFKNNNNNNVHLPEENHEREVEEKGLCVANTTEASQPSIWGYVRSRLVDRISNWEDKLNAEQRMAGVTSVFVTIFEHDDFCRIIDNTSLAFQISSKIFF